VREGGAGINGWPGGGAGPGEDASIDLPQHRSQPERPDPGSAVRGLDEPDAAGHAEMLAERLERSLLSA